MGYKVRRASNGGDRRHNRSLAETLAYGNERYGDEGWSGPNGVYSHENESYDEAVGPPDLVRRPHVEEWGPSAEGTRIFDTDKTFEDVLSKSTGKGKVKDTWWEEHEDPSERGLW